MDLGKFFGNLFSGNLFGQKKKKDEQPQTQITTQQPSFQQTLNSPFKMPGIQMPVSLVQPTQPQNTPTPLTGGIKMNTPDPASKAPTPAAPLFSNSAMRSATVQTPKPIFSDPMAINPITSAPNLTAPKAPTYKGYNLSGLNNDNQTQAMKVIDGAHPGADLNPYLKSARDTQTAKADSDWQNSIFGKIVNTGIQIPRTIVGGLLDTANFATRIPQTIETGANVLKTNTIDQLPGMEQQKQRDIAEGQVIAAKYGNLQDFMSKVTNAVSGAVPMSTNAATNREQQEISTGKYDKGGNPVGDIFSAGMKSLNLAMLVDGIINKLSPTSGETAIATSDSAPANPANPPSSVPAGVKADMAAALRNGDMDAFRAAADRTWPQMRENLYNFADQFEGKTATPAEVPSVTEATIAPSVENGIAQTTRNGLIPSENAPAPAPIDINPTVIPTQPSAPSIAPVNAPLVPTSAPSSPPITQYQEPVKAPAITSANEAARTVQPPTPINIPGVADNPAPVISNERLPAVQPSYQNPIPSEQVTPKSPIAGDGFVMSDEANPNIVKVTKQIKLINKKIADAQTGKTNVDAATFKQLISDRDALVSEAQVRATTVQTPTEVTSQTAADNSTPVAPNGVDTSSTTQYYSNSGKAPVAIESMDVGHAKNALAKLENTGQGGTPLAGALRSRIASEPTADENTIGNLPDRNKWLSSKSQVWRKTGTKAGNELADIVEATDKQAMDLRAKWMYDLKKTFGLNKRDFKAAWDVQEGKVDPSTVSPRVAEAAIQLRSVMPEVYKAAQDAGIEDVGNLGETYMPHQYSGRNQQNTVNTGSTSRSVGAKQFGNLEKERLANNPNYDKTPQAVQNYLEKSSQRIAQATNLGVKNEVANSLISEIARQGGDQGTSLKAFQNYMRPSFSNTTLSKVSRGVRGAFGVARLPLAALSHAGQTSNVAVDAGAIETAKAWASHLTRNGADKDFVDQTGVNNPQSLGHYRDNYTSIKGIQSKVTAPGLTTMLKTNRSVAAIAYRNYANALAAKGDTAGLQKLGVTGDIGDTLTPQQELEAARGGVERTMFNGSRAKTPTSAETEGGRFIGQYRLAYAYPQTRFVYENIFNEAKTGNIAPLVRYLAISGLVAAGTIATKNAIKGKSEDPAEMAWDVVAALGGIPGEMIVNGVRYGGSDIVATVAGDISASLGEAVKIGEALTEAVQGKPQQIERYGLKLIPVAGGRMADEWVPYTTDVTLGGKSVSLKGDQKDAYDKMHQDTEDTMIKQLEDSAYYKELNDADKKSAENSLKDNVTRATERMYGDANGYSNDKPPTAREQAIMNGTIDPELYTDTNLKASGIDISADLPDSEKEILKEFTRQGQKSDAWLEDNTNNANYQTAVYDNAKANGTLKPKADEDLSNPKGLKYKAVAAQVDAKISATYELKQSYGETSQAEFTAMLNPNKPDTYDPEAAQAVYDYDQARAAAGLPPKYDLAKAQKSISGSGSKKGFTFASMPSSLIGGTNSSAGSYANNAPTFKPMADLQAPAGAEIPRGRTISVKKGIQL
jgi:hypothetical protein